jgi:hypothetical protein
MDSTNDHKLASCYRLLALCARAESDPAMDALLIQAIEAFTAWEQMPAQAELHGMSPLLRHHMQRLDLSLPAEIKRTLDGLYLRGRTFHQAQVQVLLEITSLLEQNHIRALVLKGLALAYQYYPDPILRPASDIDLLLKKEDILPALQLLEKSSYKIPALTDTEMHNEWIVESPLQNGLSVRIELHHLADAEFTGFDSTPHQLQISGNVMYVPHFMDHLDYLIRHLVRHLFAATSAKPVPLKWIADIVSVVEHHAHEINWEKQAALINRLEVMYGLTAPPERLLNMIPIKRISIPHGVNQYPQGWPQYKLAEWRQVGLWGYLKKTFSHPSDWWLRLQYGIDQQSVFWHGRVVYPLQILKMALIKVIRG